MAADVYENVSLPIDARMQKLCFFSHPARKCTTVKVKTHQMQSPTIVSHSVINRT